MRWIINAVLITNIALLGGCSKGTDANVQPRITVSEPRPVAAGEDIFNVAVLSALSPGMIVTVRISAGGIELQKPYMMLVPKTPRTAGAPGGRITVTAFGNGSRVSQATATDPVVMFLENKGQTRNGDRTVSLAVPAPALIDTLEVAVTSKGESKKFNVSPIMKEYCAKAPESPSCHPVAGRKPSP